MYSSPLYWGEDCNSDKEETPDLHLKRSSLFIPVFTAVKNQTLELQAFLAKFF